MAHLISICLNCGAWFPDDKENFDDEQDCPECKDNYGYFATSMIWRKSIHKGKGKVLKYQTKKE